MKEFIDQLRTNNGYVTHTNGFRIVYYYETHYNIPLGLYTEKIEDFINCFCDEHKQIKYVSTEELARKFLEKNKEALAVAIYDINGNCAFLKNRDEDSNNITNSKISKEELIYDYGKIHYDSGYRIVSYYDNDYSIGAYSPTIEGFMYEFENNAPITEDEDIPKFVSINDLLNRYLNKVDSKIKSVAIYSVDGTCISKKSRKVMKKK